MILSPSPFSFFFFNDTATTEIYTLSLHDALPIFIVCDIAADRLGHGYRDIALAHGLRACWSAPIFSSERSEEHTSELQSLRHLVCRLLLEKKKKIRLAICCVDEEVISAVI